MTTATGSFAVNFAALSDVNPYTNANLTEIGAGRGKILSAVYRWASGAASRTAQVYNGTVSGNLAAKIEFGTAAGSGDAIAAIICDTSGNGYAAVCNSAISLSLIRISALAQADVLGSGNPAASAGDVIELRLNQTTHLLEVYKNGSTLSISATDSTVTANLKPGFMAIADNTGNATIKSFALDGSATSAVISGPTPSGTLATSTTAIIGATTDQNTGTLYCTLSTNQSKITGSTAPQVIAAQGSDGVGLSVNSNSSISSTSPTISITGLTANTTYYYAIAQDNANGNSNVLTTGSFTTAAITGVTLTWNDTNSGGAQTVIERSTNAGATWSVLTTVAAGVTSYTDTGLSSGTYYYRIRALVRSTYSSYSSTVNATI